jgi:serine/threonine protein kinase
MDYWEFESKTPRNPELVLWSLQQMLGLAEAIRALHHDLGGDLHLRHGDLKPANILFFKEDGDNFLMVADVGVSRIHEQPTLLRRVGTTTEATTRSYEAPEVAFERPGQPRARTYDIWSLGCVFLEFAIWLLYDVNAINNFEENRRDPLQNKDASFYVTTGGKAELSKDVSDAIKALREDPRCQGGTALGSLVNLIADKLLVIAVDERCKAEQLRDELHKIVQDAEQNPLYLFKAADQPNPIPEKLDPIPEKPDPIPEKPNPIPEKPDPIPEKPNPIPKIFLPKLQPSRTW